MQKKFGIAVVAALLTTPAAQAQGVVGGAQSGAERGSEQGGKAGGPIGGVVGGAVGGVTGGAGGLLGADQTPQFHDYVTREHRSSFHADAQPAVGSRLPLSGITYYRVPSEYGVDPRYRYTIVNEQPVIVDPQTRRVVQIVK